jgi:hypothetical protein
MSDAIPIVTTSRLIIRAEGEARSSRMGKKIWTIGFA